VETFGGVGLKRVRRFEGQRALCARGPARDQWHKMVLARFAALGMALAATLGGGAWLQLPNPPRPAHDLEPRGKPEGEALGGRSGADGWTRRGESTARRPTTTATTSGGATARAGADGGVKVMLTSGRSPPSGSCSSGGRCSTPATCMTTA
jgi:hypothetical protein